MQRSIAALMRSGQWNVWNFVMPIDRDRVAVFGSRADFKCCTTSNAAHVWFFQSMRNLNYWKWCYHDLAFTNPDIYLHIHLWFGSGFFFSTFLIESLHFCRMHDNVTNSRFCFSDPHTTFIKQMHRFRNHFTRKQRSSQN